ncbi:PilZ domain-containing protein [Candidatus Omnitrophota bacterium]
MVDNPKESNKKKRTFERRRFVRIDAEFMVYYTAIHERPPRSNAGQSRNISIGGILFITGREFPVGTILVVKIRLPNSPDYINLKVQVVDSKQKVKDIMYDTRAKFIGVEEKDIVSMQKVIEYHEQMQREKKSKGEISEK